MATTHFGKDRGLGADDSPVNIEGTVSAFDREVRVLLLEEELLGASVYRHDDEGSDMLSQYYAASNKLRVPKSGVISIPRYVLSDFPIRLFLKKQFYLVDDTFQWG